LRKYFFSPTLSKREAIWIDLGDWGSLDILPAFGAGDVGSNPASPALNSITARA
tara:strand:- start:435 stop:596 length:162 start_codon:yes stop_codon:yes gene_type:complete